MEATSCQDPSWAGRKAALPLLVHFPELGSGNWKLWNWVCRGMASLRHVLVGKRALMRNHWFGRCRGVMRSCQSPHSHCPGSLAVPGETMEPPTASGEVTCPPDCFLFFLLPVSPVPLLTQTLFLLSSTVLPLQNPKMPRPSSLPLTITVSWLGDGTPGTEISMF